MKYLFFCFALIAHVEVLAQGHPIIDSLFMIGELQLSPKSNINTDKLVPTFSCENGEIAFHHLHNKNKILVIKPSNEGFLEIGTKKYHLLKDYLYFFPILKEENVYLRMDGLLEVEPLDSLYSFLLPEFYSIYSYPSMFRSSGIGRQNLNFFTECFLKNFNDNRKNLSALKSTTSIVELTTKREILNINFEGNRYNGPLEGIFTSGQNDMETVDHMQFWNHEHPNLYERIFNIWSGDEAPDIQESRAIVGFRDVRLKENILFVNEKKVSLKSYYFKSIRPEINDSLLITLKKMHFNCLILGEKVPERVFEFCDSIGIYTIQVADNSMFATPMEWVNYHILTKEHPSLIGWLNAGINDQLQKIIKEIDKDRILFNRPIFPVFAGLKRIEIAEFEQILGSLQPIKYSFNGTSRTLEIKFEEYADFITNLKLVVTSINETGEVAYHEEVSLNDPNNDNATAITLNDRHLPTTECQFKIRFELVFKEDIGLYKSGELFGIYNLSIQKIGDIYKTSEISLGIPYEYVLREFER